MTEQKQPYRQIRIDFAWYHWLIVAYFPLTVYFRSSDPVQAMGAGVGAFVIVWMVVTGIRRARGHPETAAVEN